MRSWVTCKCVQMWAAIMIILRLVQCLLWSSFCKGERVVWAKEMWYHPFAVTQERRDHMWDKETEYGKSTRNLRFFRARIWAGGRLDVEGMGVKVKQLSRCAKVRGPWWWRSLEGLSFPEGWDGRQSPPPSSPSGCFPPQIPPGLWPFYRHFYSCWWELISLLVLLAQGFLAFTCRNTCRKPHAGEALSSMSQYISLHSRNIRQSSSSSPTGFFPPFQHSCLK